MYFACWCIACPLARIAFSPFILHWCMCVLQAQVTTSRFWLGDLGLHLTFLLPCDPDLAEMYPWRLVRCVPDHSGWGFFTLGDNTLVEVCVSLCTQLTHSKSMSLQKPLGFWISILLVFLPMTLGKMFCVCISPGVGTFKKRLPETLLFFALNVLLSVQYS